MSKGKEFLMKVNKYWLVGIGVEVEMIISTIKRFVQPIIL
jgi:hypothetical protein